MDLKQLEAFVSVVQTGSFSRAAQRLFLTQPTVSAHIKTLERELGAQLIARTVREAQPTQAGQVLYEHAVEMLALRDRAIQRCTLTHPEHTGEISVAASTIPYQFILPRAMAAFRQRHPQTRFTLHRCDSAGVAQALLAGTSEIGLTGTQLIDPGLSYTTFAEDELVIIAPPAAPYQQMREGRFPLGSLTGLPFVAREEGSGTRREAEAFLAQHGIAPQALQIVAQLDNPQAVQNAVAQGLGISIVSRLSAQEAVDFGKVISLPLSARPVLRKLYLVRHTTRPVCASAAAFFHFVQSSCDGPA